MNNAEKEIELQQPAENDRLADDNKASSVSESTTLLVSNAGKQLQVSRWVQQHFQPTNVTPQLSPPPPPAYTRHVAWVPIFPSGGKGTSFSSAFGRGTIAPGLLSMHFLTTALRNLEPRIDDDFIDRLNYYYTSSIIIIFSILVSAKQYVGHPIECWVPAQFTKAMEQYTENYCWIQNTYWVPFQDLIPSNLLERERRQIGYYQWVPFILAIQAFMFYIPAVVWRLMSTQSGINVHGILQMAADDHNIEPDNRSRSVTILSRHIDDALHYQREYGHKKKSVYLWACVRLGKYYGAYVSLLYCFIKLLYFLNVLGQFFLLNRFLQTSEYPYFGAHVLWDMLQGQEWQTSGKFPRVTLCDFEIRVLGNIHRHTVQCCLVINMFTEKIFIFLWLWLLILGLLCLLSLLYWFTSLVTPSFRMSFIMKHLELSDRPPEKKEKKQFRRFVVNFLRPDGVFILRMIAAHAGTVLCTEIAHELWAKFKERTYRPPVVDEAVGDSESDEGHSSTAPTERIPSISEKLDKILNHGTMEESRIDPEPKLTDDKPDVSRSPLVSFAAARRPWTGSGDDKSAPKKQAPIPPLRSALSGSVSTPNSFNHKKPTVDTVQETEEKAKESTPQYV